MEKKQLETEWEEQYLQKTLAIAKKQLDQAKKAAEEKKSGIAEVKKEARENATHGITNLYDADDFEALAEFSQYANAVTEMISDYEEEKRKITRLENFMRVPYFARMDFRFADDGEDGEAEKIYIGRTALTQKSAGDIYVYDWRSPVAGVFYRFMSGKAFYDAPCGKVEGTVERKRQYEIKNGVLEYFFDTDRNISDEILRQMLSRNASPKMKAIVETIQKEQDEVIRDMENDLLIVQGVAGSGKTSIALHRAAYLMYQGLQTRLAANSILILSPNNAFAQYISEVLPELGEENVNTAVFDDILEHIFKDRQIQRKYEYLEQAVTNNQIVKQSMEFKMSEYFRKILDSFLADIPSRFIAYRDIYFEGNCVADAQAMREWMMLRPDVPLGLRLEQLEEYVQELAFGPLKKKKDAQERNRMKQETERFTQFDIIEMYQKLFSDKSYFDSLAEEQERLTAENVKEKPADVLSSKPAKAVKEKPADVLNSDPVETMTENPKEELWKETAQQLDKDRIWSYTRENLLNGNLCYDDAIAAAYLYLKIYGSNAYRNIRQVVIDEAQDYYPLQYEIFRLLFANAKYTVLGDMNQTLAKEENLSFYSRIPHILGKKKASFISLNKSFRCTNEILNFSLQFIEQKPDIHSFNRSGDSPKVIAADNFHDLLEIIAKETENCLAKGDKTVCLILKTVKNAVRLYEHLKERMDVQLVTDSGMESAQGVFLMPVYMAKGLEFDAVIVCDADADNYSTSDDRKLLYVECTRALHRLCLTGKGTISGLIADGGPAQN